MLRRPTRHLDSADVGGLVDLVVSVNSDLEILSSVPGQEQRTGVSAGGHPLLPQVPLLRFTGGRPRTAGLAKEIRKRFGDDGRSLIDACEGLLHDPKTPAATRLAAATMLLERGYGKVPNELSLDVTTGESAERVADYSLLSDEELATILRLERKALGSGDITDGEIIENE